MSESQINFPGLETEQAIKLIIAAMNSGTLKLPFLSGLDPEAVENEIRKFSATALKTPENVRRYELAALADQVVPLARLDALVILTFLLTLTNGVTKEEAERLSFTLPGKP